MIYFKIIKEYSLDGPFKRFQIHSAKEVITIRFRKNNMRYSFLRLSICKTYHIDTFVVMVNLSAQFFK